MRSAYDVDHGKLPPSDATGYYRNALGPLHPSPKEGAGWLSAMGELSMTAEDLARWDISLIERSLLQPQSYDEMFRNATLKNGKPTGYGLGLFVRTRNGHTMLGHSGEVSGFVSDTEVIPDRKTAVVVLTNEMASTAAGTISHDLVEAAIGRNPAEARTLQILTGLQNGQIDRSQFTQLCNNYFSEQAIRDFADSLKPLGEPLNLSQDHESHRGGMIFRVFTVQFASRNLELSTYEMPDGKLEQFLIGPKD